MVYMHLFNYFLVEKLFGGKNHYGVEQGVAVDGIAHAFLNGLMKKEKQ
jgi:hypothetical protein